MLAHIFDELKICSKYEFFFFSDSVRIEKKEESIEKDSQVQGSIYKI